MNPRFPFLSQRVFNTPLAIRPEKAEVIVSALAERLGIGQIGPALRAEVAAADGFSAAGPTIRRGYDVVAGVAVIEVQGTLVQRLGTLRPYSGMTGYDGIRENLLTALADPEVRAIALDLDSPGGEIAGLFGLTDMIFASRGRKPIWGICAECAYSAAYSIASACDRITVPRTGGTGSIGVITMLVDFSAALGKAGLAVHFIHFGARKAEEGRAAYEGVKPEVLARIQAEIDAAGALFAETVARNRGLAATDIVALQAACLTGAAGVAAGLADAVMEPDEAFRALLATF